MKKIFLSCFILFAFFLGLTSVKAEGKAVLLVAGHGEGGSQVPGTSFTYNNIKYVEAIETRKLVKKIAEQLDDIGVSYEIANKELGDTFWKDDQTSCSTCGDKVNGSGGTRTTCCEYVNIISTQRHKLSDAFVSKYTKEYMQKFGMILEIHFNGSEDKNAQYSLVYLPTNGADRLMANGLGLATSVGGVLGATNPQAQKGEFAGDGGTLSTLEYFEDTLKVDSYLLETTFMSNETLFKKYLDKKADVAKAIAFQVKNIVGTSTTNGPSGDIGSNPDDGNGTEDPEEPKKDNPLDDGDLNYGEGDGLVTGEGGCETVFKNKDGSFNELGQALQDLFMLMKIAAPLLVVVLSTMDYIKAVSAQNADEMKKANGRFVKRLAAGVVVFLLPFLLDLLFEIFGLYGIETCGIR